MKRKLRPLIVIACIALALASLPFIFDAHVRRKASPYIISKEEALALDADCVLVLGAYASGDSLSAMLEDRVNRGIWLYENGAARKLLMSGDHGRKDYDEVNAMKNYAMAKGVPGYDVFMDHAGFSTYESLYRARDVFGAKKIIIVTQEYHLYRALYIAKQLGIEAYGVPADLQRYAGEQARLTREFLARNKDFVLCIFKPKPTYLGPAIPLSGSGDVTNDR